MPRVKVRHFASLRELLGNTRKEEYEVSDGTMLMNLLLEYIPKRHWNVSRSWKKRLFEMEEDGIKLNADGTPVLGFYSILINGRECRSISEEGRRPGLRYELRDGDVIAILPPVGGG